MIEMVPPPDAAAAAPEGITVRPVHQDLLVDVVRHDVTRVSIAPQGFTQAVAELIGSGGYAIVDKRLRVAWADDLDPLLVDSRCLVLESGEASKTSAQVEQIITRLHEAGVHRRSMLIAIGGGVITDVVGLVAALYFRGVPVAYVPTTLLGMIDSAVGGKTAVNHPRQKNLIGVFSHPAEIRIRLDVLQSLPPTERVSAYGEALKIAIVGAPELFEVLADGIGDPPDVQILEQVVRTCVTKKLQLLNGNCFERSLRRELNLGHTVAHPLEDITGFRIRHGIAVGIGIAVACHISHRRGLLDAGTFDRILHTMDQLKLPVVDNGFDDELLFARIQRLLLQRGGSSLHYVLPTSIGSVTFADHVTPAELRCALSDLREREKPR